MPLSATEVAAIENAYQAALASTDPSAPRAYYEALSVHFPVYADVAIGVIVLLGSGPLSVDGYLSQRKRTR